MSKPVLRWPDRPWREWYQCERWRRRRRLHLRGEPLCRSCLSNGLVRLATIADHVTPHAGNWNAFLTSPLQSLCSHCHESHKKFSQYRGFERPSIGLDGWPIELTNGGPPHGAHALQGRGGP